MKKALKGDAITARWL